MRRCNDCCGCGTLDGECICSNCKGKGYIPESDEDKRILSSLKFGQVYKEPGRYGTVVLLIFALLMVVFIITVIILFGR